jgi:transcriptional regulator with PAS, ATPase and Fis domain
MANHGTIFLDEFGDISPGIQLKLLRVLENKEIERVGDPKPVKLDVQVISATNADLRDRVMQGTFREDLYYRIKVVELHLPSLRERRDDIPLLTAHYLTTLRARFSKNITALSPEVERLFMEYPWPGNVRELIHTLEHAFVVCRGDTIGRQDLPPEIRRFDSPGDAPGKTSSTGWTILQTMRRCRREKGQATPRWGLAPDRVLVVLGVWGIASWGRLM